LICWPSRQPPVGKSNANAEAREFDNLALVVGMHVLVVKIRLVVKEAA
jgi:hypothetical protein